MNHVLTVGLFSLLSVTGMQAQESADFKSIPLHIFMQDQIVGTYPMSIPVPVEYDAADLPDVPSTYSYWMRETDVPRARETQDLPAGNGFMYGKITINVGYDSDTDTFLGVEERKYRREAKKQFSTFQLERASVGDHAILLMKATDKSSGTRMYAIYFATNIETNVVYVAYRPANNSEMLGELFWNRVKQEIEQSNKVPDGAPASLEIEG